MGRSTAFACCSWSRSLPACSQAVRAIPTCASRNILESGNRYRDEGKLPEAAIQYQNAIQLDPRFAEAHYQLAETYLKIDDSASLSEALPAP